MSDKKTPYDAIERVICGQCGVEMKVSKEDQSSRTYSCIYEEEGCYNSVIIHMESE